MRASNNTFSHKLEKTHDEYFLQKILPNPWKKKCSQIILLVKQENFHEKNPGVLDYGCFSVSFPTFSEKLSLKKDPEKLKLFTKIPQDSEIIFSPRIFTFNTFETHVNKFYLGSQFQPHGIACSFLTFQWSSGTKV